MVDGMENDFPMGKRCPTVLETPRPMTEAGEQDREKESQFAGRRRAEVPDTVKFNRSGAI